MVLSIFIENLVAFFVQKEHWESMESCLNQAKAQIHSIAEI